jgi:hypothetical protein
MFDILLERSLVALVKRFISLYNDRAVIFLERSTSHWNIRAIVSWNVRSIP